MTYTGKIARVRYTSAAASSSTDEAATLSTDGVTLQIDATGKRHWNPASPGSVAVAIGGTPTTDARTVNYVQGKIVFSTAHSTASVYTIDTEWFPTSYMTGGRDWSVDITRDIRDHTTFSTSTSDVAWRTKKAGLAEASVSIGRLVSTGSTGPLAYDRINAETRLLVELVADGSSGGGFEGYGWIGSDSFGVDVDGDATENISIDIDGELYWTD
jgi:hypothetical protein